VPACAAFESISDAVNLAVRLGLPQSISGDLMRRKLLLWATAVSAALILSSLHSQVNPAVRIILMEDDAGIVLGQPCSVVEQTEVTRQLADGTTLTQHTVVHKWRDDQGRFRRESADVKGDDAPVFQRATIIDPVNNTLVTLNLDRKTATVYHLPDHGPEALHPYVDQFDKEILALPGVQVKVEKLGGKTIAGVYAEGRRVTRFRPPGTVGNDKPIVSVRDQWIAQDLKILLASSSDDPRQKQVNQVTQLDRSVPDPALFSIPSDFTMRDVPVPSQQNGQ
jgi:hypothetical protein